MPPVPITLDQIQSARSRIEDAVTRTPLVRFGTSGPGEIWLKLENRQPIGSFKLRGAGSAMTLLAPEELADGVWTASAGNMAQGVAWYARRLGVPATVVVPETAPKAKLDAIARLGATIVKAPFADWFETFRSRRYPGIDGLFVHAFEDPAVMAGNGTIALEIDEELPAVDRLLVPYGGGGLACGIASAFRGLGRRTEVLATEVETGAPFAAALAAGRPIDIDYRPSFVDGIGGPFVFPEMFERARDLLHGSLVVSVAATAEAVRLLYEEHGEVAEGAGATSLAAALDCPIGGVTVCVVSGGNLDRAKLETIVEGGIPG